ncbi:hypothetical protein V6N12_074001 [Hibiscus sabdariffa]|uniref:lipid-A-disaccharide synthase n=1 Tax=Hibiscus sabdariffa TaxID=183260 RepID=A0ABR2BFH9_9ROSI
MSMSLAAIRCVKICKSSICLTRRYLWVSSKSLMDRAAMEGELRVFIVAGEVSGDTIGSRLMASLKKISPVPIRFSGVGGSMMSNQGLKSLFPMENIAVMGIWELLPHLYNFRVKLKETVEAAFQFQPHVVVTVDSKGFSFRLLEQLRARYDQQRADGPVHFHFVAPSFWAWKGGEARLRVLSKFVDHVFCILPNEEAVCESNGLAATFVGHPILEDVLELNMGKETASHEWKITGNGEDFRERYAIPSGATVITLLPGSRLQEVTRMLPIFSNTMKLLKDSFHELITVITVAPNRLVDNYIARAIDTWPVPAILVPGGTQHLKLKYDAFNFLCRRAKLPYVRPELLLWSCSLPALFQACTPAKVASSLKELMNDAVLQQQQIVAAEKVMELLRPPNRTVNNSEPQDMKWTPPGYTPSMIAASTILSYKQR